MNLFERHLYQQLITQIDDREFIIISGARQTGKSTILKQIANFLAGRENKYFEISLEDFHVLAKLNDHPENLFSYVPKPQNTEKIYVLLDEIQYLQNPTNFLKFIYDKFSSNLKIIATGSSAFYIDTKFKDSLAGRKQLFELSTLSFTEFLLFKTANNLLNEELQEIRRNNRYLSSKRIEIANYFDEYLTYGGFPAVVLAEKNEKKLSLLKELLNSYIKRDIAEANIQNQEKFYNLLLILAEQTGNLLNVNEISQTLGLSTTSVNNYLYVLQKCFHISLLRPYYRNMRKELTKMPKIYFNDLGLRNVLLNQFQHIETRLDKGALLENYLYLRLIEKYSSDNLRYWRTINGNEVDFVVLNGLESGFAIECKFQNQNYKPKFYNVFTEAYPQIPIQFRTYKAENNGSWVLSV